MGSNNIIIYQQYKTIYPQYCVRKCFAAGAVARPAALRKEEEKKKEERKERQEEKETLGGNLYEICKSKKLYSKS